MSQKTPPRWGEVLAAYPAHLTWTKGKEKIESKVGTERRKSPDPVTAGGTGPRTDPRHGEKKRSFGEKFQNERPRRQIGNDRPDVGVAGKLFREENMTKRRSRKREAKRRAA